MTPPGDRRHGAAREADGPRDARGRRPSRRPRGPGPWGTWQGGLGVCIVVASAAAGVLGTILTRSAPGLLLGFLVVAGTLAATLAVRPKAGRMILPVPVLAYLVAALVSGVVFDRSAASSRTELVVGAAQWVANGFFAMALATGLAAVITAIRWYLWRRSRRDRPAARGPGGAAPARPARAGSRPAHAGPAQARSIQTGPAPNGRRPRTGWEAPAEPGSPAGHPGPGRGRPGGADGIARAGDEPGPRGTAPRPGPGSYNFSSGA